MTKVLLSGATGFVGSRLGPKLLARPGYEVCALSSASGDVADPKTWSALPVTDVVVHLAARTFVPDSWVEPAAFLGTNLLGTVNALEFCRSHKSRLVFLSSYLYGNPHSLPIAEDFDVLVNNPYALSKKLAEETCQFYSDCYGLDITILRVFNIYGGGQDDKFLIPSIVRQVQQGAEINVKDLEPKRDFLYIDDLLDAVACAVEHPHRFEIFNIASGNSHSVREVIDCVQKITGRTVSVHSENVRRQNEIMDTRADITKARRMLGWEPRWSLEAGIAEICRAGC